MWGWVKGYGPEMERRLRLRLKPTNDSWRVDETYIRVKHQSLTCRAAKRLFLATCECHHHLSATCIRLPGRKRCCGTRLPRSRCWRSPRSSFSPCMSPRKFSPFFSLSCCRSPFRACLHIYWSPLSVVLPEKRCLDSWLSLSCLERLSWVQRFWPLESFPRSTPKA